MAAETEQRLFRQQLRGKGTPQCSPPRHLGEGREHVDTLAHRLVDSMLQSSLVFCAAPAGGGCGSVLAEVVFVIVWQVISMVTIEAVVLKGSSDLDH